ncbi:exported hypothetical protein [Desulfamplus magnetovallimortis]|uniref:Uncharacterized protein n=1 Tax=Desulfamplus magnetovallimortis TaxID=1246637 RepID=A0A1W1HC22_9BACT|nr:hypothetical protein [Desulfamplus magnetovallimortis]SLM29935.1 exported hypothetical protein [Desulfamplus magnetovallimortis]
MTKIIFLISVITFLFLCEPFADENIHNILSDLSSPERLEWNDFKTREIEKLKLKNKISLLKKIHFDLKNELIKLKQEVYFKNSEHDKITKENIELRKETNVFLTELSIKEYEIDNIRKEILEEDIKFGRVRCDKFEIHAELDNNNSTISISINTDLPKSTLVNITINRMFVNAEDNQKYAIDYFAKKVTVSEWEKTRSITLDQKKWENQFKSQIINYRLEGKKKDIDNLKFFNVTDIDNYVNIYTEVSMDQSDERFGNRNKNLVGQLVTTSEESKTVRNITKAYHTIDANKLINTQPPLYKHNEPKSQREAPLFDCYYIGYKYGRCATLLTKGKNCDLESDKMLTIPVSCRGQESTERGISAGVFSAWYSFPD